MGIYVSHNIEDNAFTEFSRTLLHRTCLNSTQTNLEAIQSVEANMMTIGQNPINCRGIKIHNLAFLQFYDYEAETHH